MLRNCRVMSSLVKIDGSQGEGGGQVLRVALSLSALYGIPIEIENIRAGRPKPGLAAQHLKGVELVRDMCNARVRGGYIGSTRLEFHPGPLDRNKLTFVADTQTAGCICLLAQVALPCALFFPCSDAITLILKGGTNVPMGPQIEYLTEVFKPNLNKFGADFNFTVVKRGYYPKGGGELRLKIKPVSNLNAISLLDPGIPKKITGWSYVAGTIHFNDAKKMAYDAAAILRSKLAENNVAGSPSIAIESYREDRLVAVGNGCGINIVCTTSTGCVLGGSGLSSNRTEEQSPAETAAYDILKPLLAGSCVDEHTQDQMIILMALAKGTSRIKLGQAKLTCHTETAMQIAEMMLGKHGLRFNLSKSAESGDTSSLILECHGCGLINDGLDK